MLIPGNPAELALSGNNAQAYTQEDLEMIEKELGLDKPKAQQYVTWIKNVAKGT